MRTLYLILVISLCTSFKAIGQVAQYYSYVHVRMKEKNTVIVSQVVPLKASNLDDFYTIDGNELVCGFYAAVDPALWDFFGDRPELERRNGSNPLYTLKEATLDRQKLIAYVRAHNHEKVISVNISRKTCPN
jgi:hypothetical protein